MPKDANKVKKEKKHFFKDFKAELKKVIWPTPKQLVNNTVAVITIVIITAVIVFALDLVFEKLNTYGVNKLKEMVENSVDTENTQQDDEEQNNEEENNEAQNADNTQTNSENTNVEAEENNQNTQAQENAQ